MSRTHSEYVGDGYYVTVQYCENCDEYLGIDYPALYCHKCKYVEEI